MKHLRHFETTSAFTEAYNGSENKKPWVSYTEDNHKVNYNRDDSTDYSKLESFGTGKYIHYFETAAKFNETRIKTTSPCISYVEEGEKVAYNITEEERERIFRSMPFTIEALGNGNIKWGLGSKTVQYSKNGDSWSTMNSGTTISVVAGDEVQFKGTNTDYNENTISATTQFNVKGNIMSLIAGNDFETANTVNGRSFRNLFKNCSYIISASDLQLPATTLANSCYASMFQYCTNLTTAPKLPATSLAGGGGCYYGMFYGCTSLTTAPALPATRLIGTCYTDMFRGCTKLTTVPDELPATTLKQQCYDSMFRDCKSLTTAPKLPATTLASKCYNSMFNGCTSLTTAPELPATTLVINCYESMFSGCISLTTAPELPATTLASYCYFHMFNGCTSLTTTPVLPATTLNDSCYNNMFNGCYRLKTVPELPAMTLVNFCYNSMFYGCTSLNYIKCLATNVSANSCTSNWVNGVASSGTFVKNPNMSSWSTGDQGIPSGWTVQDA